MKINWKRILKSGAIGVVALLGMWMAFAWYIANVRGICSSVPGEGVKTFCYELIVECRPPPYQNACAHNRFRLRLW